MLPCRASTCDHLQCFDASLYLQMNERKPTWTCPVCDKSALYDYLVIDGQGKFCLYDIYWVLLLIVFGNRHLYLIIIFVLYIISVIMIIVIISTYYQKAYIYFHSLLATSKRSYNRTPAAMRSHFTKMEVGPHSCPRRRNKSHSWRSGNRRLLQRH